MRMMLKIMIPTKAGKKLFGSERQRGFSSPAIPTSAVALHLMRGAGKSRHALSVVSKNFRLAD
jgi:hypothetical protein